jgi:molybdopterin-guanine dinucleotide biosynthesis protein A
MTFSAVLLTGGESRRMGRDKATIVVDGLPLWQRQLQILRELNPEKIFVSARVTPSWLPPKVELLLDEPPSRGPLSGLAQALDRMRTTHLIALAVDMPFMTSSEMQCLCNLVKAGTGVVPVIGDRAEPLAAIYPGEVLNDFVLALGGTDFSLQSLVRELARSGKIEMIVVEEERRDLYRSVNEPGDLLL